MAFNSALSAMKSILTDLGFFLYPDVDGSALKVVFFCFMEPGTLLKVAAGKRGMQFVGTFFIFGFGELGLHRMGLWGTIVFEQA
jgi:hypothetical protein